MGRGCGQRCVVRGTIPDRFMTHLAMMDVVVIGASATRSEPVTDAP